MDNTVQQSRYNTVLIGAGPIGIEVAAALSKYRIPYLHVEAQQIGHSITRWAPQTVFFSSPEWIALCGIPIHSDSQQQISGETYLAYMRQIVETLDLQIQTYEKVVTIERETDTESAQDGYQFTIHTESAHGARRYFSNHIILALGNMQRYNRLNIKGEQQAHICYDYHNPHLYFQKRLLIVGGKNSALEAALRCWRAGANVTISYRQKQLNKVGILDRLYLEIAILLKNRQIKLLAPTKPISFAKDKTVLSRIDSGKTVTVDSDFVYIATGFSPDNTLYEQLGIRLVAAEQKPMLNPNSLETNVPGIYVAGTAIAGKERRYTQFITTCHHHAQSIVRSILNRNDIAAKSGNYHARNYDLSSDDLE